MSLESSGDDDRSGSNLSLNRKSTSFKADVLWSRSSHDGPLFLLDQYLASSSEAFLFTVSSLSKTASPIDLLQTLQSIEQYLAMWSSRPLVSNVSECFLCMSSPDLKDRAFTWSLKDMLREWERSLSALSKPARLHQLWCHHAGGLANEWAQSRQERPSTGFSFATTLEFKQHLLISSTSWTYIFNHVLNIDFRIQYAILL